METVRVIFSQVSGVSTSHRFFKSLKLVAVDELHYYTGLFGRLVQTLNGSSPTCSSVLAMLHR